MAHPDVYNLTSLTLLFSSSLNHNSIASPHAMEPTFILIQMWEYAIRTINYRVNTYALKQIKGI